MFPDFHDKPSGRLKLLRSVGIALDVSLQLLGPPFGIGSGFSCSGHPCQKQPCTKKATLVDGNTMSALRRLPAKTVRSSLYGSPLAWRARSGIRLSQPEDLLRMRLGSDKTPPRPRHLATFARQ